MAGGKAWPFFLFQLDLPDMASDSESEKSNELPWSIGVLLSCFHRTVSSFWRPMSLALSSVIFKLACVNFLSAFRWWSHLAEAFSPLPVKLSWRSCYKLSRTTKLAHNAWTARTTRVATMTPLHHPMTHLSPHYLTMMNNNEIGRASCRERVFQGDVFHHQSPLRLCHR